MAAQRIEHEGRGPAQRIRLRDVQQLPRLDLVTELKCVEGWSQVMHFGGVRFLDLLTRYNLGTRSSEWTGANLYDRVGYTPLVLISTAFTAAAWILVPLVPIDAIEASAREPDA